MLKNLSELLEYQSNKIPSKPYLNNFELVINFEQFNFLVNKCCNFFKTIDLNKKDVISICLSNKIEILILYFASIRFGAIFYLLSINDSETDLLNKLKFVNSKIVFIDNEKKFNEIKSKTNSFYITKFFIDELNNYESQFLNGDINENDIAGYYSSSGTTNEPKTICYTHKNMISGIFTVFNSQLFKNVKRHLCILPLFHTSALRYTIKSALINGSEVFIAQNFWSIKDKIWEIVTKFDINFFQMVPSIVNIILNNKNTNKMIDLSNNLDFCGCGSSFLPTEYQIDFEKKYNVKLLNLYGLSEIGASHYEDPHHRKIGSIGKPFDKYIVKIFDSKFKECKVSEPGQIAVKGDPVFKSYLKQDNKNIFKKGFFLTGDFGYFDQDGFFYFIDRTKDLVIKGGTNISPNEIDKIILTYNGVTESATVPISDKFFGEVPYTFIVVENQSSFNVDKLRDYCKKNLGIFKTPSGFTILNEIPKGPSGKILKRLLKKL